tara:strand:- start:432 stop:629 length:198 start_codon:yes stop_codon:yes gene_type:complete
MQVNTDSVAILTKSILRSEVEVLKSRLDTPVAGPGSPRYLGDMADLRNAVRVLEKRIRELEGAGV